MSMVASPLPRSRPSEQAVRAGSLLRLLDALRDDALGMHSLMVLRHGAVIAEGYWAPYAASRRHLVYSLSKTLTATAIGILVAQGRLRVDDRILDVLPATAATETAAPEWRNVRIEHCLSMTVGHEVDAWNSVDVMKGDWLAQCLAIPPTKPPGTFFAYNQIAIYLLAHVARAASGGEGLVRVLRPLLNSLGILGVDDATDERLMWLRDGDGVELGYSGAFVHTETLAKFGLLYLRGGVWTDGVRHLTEDFVAQATRAYLRTPIDPSFPTDWKRGYGYTLWQNRHGFRGDGAYGQFMIVLPAYDAVVVVTGEENDMQAVMEHIWNHLLPACLGHGDDPDSGENSTRDDDANDADDEKELADRLAHLTVPAPAPKFLPSPPEVSSAFTFVHNAPQSLPGFWTRANVETGEVSNRSSTLRLERKDTWLDVSVGTNGAWEETMLEADGTVVYFVASGGWTTSTDYVVDIRVIETPHVIRIRGSSETGLATIVWSTNPLHGPDPFYNSPHNTRAGKGLQ
ncbi:hypothetical protein HDU82_003861 [Entophlyctis luteolus]|nr:hypothetical protein HDU82_003861 [Entophlyctis luteolus]